MFKTTMAITLGVSLSASAAYAECTQESLQQNVVEISTRAQTLAASDPTKMQEIMVKLQEAGQKFTETSDLEAACTAYDEILALMEE